MTRQNLLTIRQAAAYLMAKTKDQSHNLFHCQRVWSNAQKIAKIHQKLKIDQKILESACLLHDLSYSRYPASIGQYLLEGQRSQKIASQILNQTSISQPDTKIILTAITRHCHSFPFRQLNRNGSVYDQILQDADTLDLLYPQRKTNRLISFFWLKLASLIKKHPHLFLNLPQSTKILDP